MLITLLLAPFWAFLNMIIALFPDVVVEALFVDSFFVDAIEFGINFIGHDMFRVIISSGVFWTSTQLLWSVIDFILQKIPGVN